MTTHAFSTAPATTGALTRETATAAQASSPVTKLWPAILAMAAVGGSLALTCVAPFDARVYTDIWGQTGARLAAAMPPPDEHAPRG